MTNIWPLQNEAMAFYGDPRKPNWYGENVVAVKCPWPLFMGAAEVQSIAIHRKIAPSLTAALVATWAACDQSLDTIQRLRYDRYDGSYNLRVMRGGSSISMHGFAVAVDWDAADNPQHSQHHIFTDTSPLVVAFKNEGWIWGGDWNPGSIDAMHVQAARVHS